MTGYVKTSAISQALCISRKETMARARTEGWPCVRQKGGLAFLENRLPAGVRLALAGRELPETAIGTVEGGLS